MPVPVDDTAKHAGTPISSRSGVESGSGQGSFRVALRTTAQEVFDSRLAASTLTPQELLEGDMADETRPRRCGPAAGDGAPRAAAHHVAADRGGDERGRGGPRPGHHPRQRVVPPASAARHRRARGGERGEDPRRRGQALPLRRHPRGRRPHEPGRRPDRLRPRERRGGGATAARRGAGLRIVQRPRGVGAGRERGTARSTCSTRPRTSSTPTHSRPAPRTPSTSARHQRLHDDRWSHGAAARWIPSEEPDDPHRIIRPARRAQLRVVLLLAPGQHPRRDDGQHRADLRGARHRRLAHRDRPGARCAHDPDDPAAALGRRDRRPVPARGRAADLQRRIGALAGRSSPCSSSPGGPSSG